MVCYPRVLGHTHYFLLLSGEEVLLSSTQDKVCTEISLQLNWQLQISRINFSEEFFTGILIFNKEYFKQHDL